MWSSSEELGYHIKWEVAPRATNILFNLVLIALKETATFMQHHIAIKNTAIYCRGPVPTKQVLLIVIEVVRYIRYNTKYESLYMSYSMKQQNQIMLRKFK